MAAKKVKTKKKKRTVPASVAKCQTVVSNYNKSRSLTTRGKKQINKVQTKAKKKAVGILTRTIKKLQ